MILRQIAVAALAVLPTAAAPSMSLSITSPCPRASLDGVAVRATVNSEPREFIGDVRFNAQRNGWVVPAPPAAVHVGAAWHDDQAVFVPLLPGRWYFTSSARVRAMGGASLRGEEVTAHTDMSLLCEVQPTTINVAITTDPASGQAHLGNPVKVTVTASYNSYLTPLVKIYNVEVRSLSGTLIAQQNNQTPAPDPWTPNFSTGGTYKISAAVNVYAPGPGGEELLALGASTINFTILP